MTLAHLSGVAKYQGGASGRIDVHLTGTLGNPDSRRGSTRPTGHWSHVLSVSDHLPRALFVVCWMAAMAMPASAVMPTPAGTVPPELAQAFDARLFDVPVHAGHLGTSAVQTVWNVPVILVGFSNQALGTSIYGGDTPAQYFDRTLFDTNGVTATGSVFDYYRWVSGNRIRVIGKVVATIALAPPKDYYANNNWGLGLSAPRNMYGFVNASLQSADSLVDWRPYDQNGDGFVDMLWVVHSGLPGEATIARDNLWSVTSRLTAWSNGESFETHSPRPGAPSIKIRVDRFSVLPELSSIRSGQPSEIGVYCHEFGHALGLPDLYDASTVGGTTNSGPGNWSLMATGSYGTDGLSPEFPSHLGAWPMKWLGWRDVVRPTSDSLIVQGSLESGAPIVEAWFQGEDSPEHFLIENRQREGFDRNLLGEGLLVYQVNENVLTTLAVASNRVNVGTSQGLRLIEADGLNDLISGVNRGDGQDPFPGFLGRTEFDDETVPNTRSVLGAYTNVALHQIQQIGDDVRYRLQVRAPGWEPAALATPGGFSPIWPSGAANRALSLADGSVTVAMSERRAGRPQIVLRTRPPIGDWAEPVQVSESPGSATDPSVAALPGGRDLVVTWSDTRHGSGELYYRSRIGGVWSNERRLTDLVGDSRYPSVGVDRFGRVHVAWLYTEGALPRVRYMTFTYYSPFGTSIVVTAASASPDAPVVAVAPDGVSYVLWSDRSSAASSVWYARSTPATGFDIPRLVAGNGYSQPAVDAAADATGMVHIVWQVSGSGGVNQLRYQRRLPNGTTDYPIETVIVSRGESIQNPVVRVDEAGGVHAGFIAINGGISQVRYNRRDPVRGWDHGSTEITMVTEGGAARPMIAPGSAGEVSVLYFLPTAETERLMERRRFVPELSVSVPAPVRPLLRLELRLGPSPLRAGQPLRLHLGGEAPASGGVIEIFDLAGRSVRSTPLVQHSGGWSAEIPGTITRGWGSGVYFARLRGDGALAARLVVLR